MTPYEKFKSALAELCERGKITKDVKKTFSRYENTEDCGEIVFALCNDLHDLFEKSPLRSSEYASVCECAAALINDLSESAPQALKHDYEFLCSFVTLTSKANAIAKPYALEQVIAFTEQYNKSLQSVKYGMPLF